MKLCPYCGSELNDDAKFCGECGKPLPEDAPAVTEAVVDGLFCRDVSRRMSMKEFRAVLLKEWGV